MSSRTDTVLVLDTGGAPLTTASLTFVACKTLGGATVASPAVRNLGSGLYAFDVPEGAGYLLTTGALPPYYADANGFEAFACYDSSGALAPSATPTAIAYDASGPLTPPVVHNLGGGLYGLSVVGSYLVTTGAEPPYYSGGGAIDTSGRVDAPAPSWTYTPPTKTATPVARDFAFDHTTGRFYQYDNDLVLTAEVQGLRQAVEIELRTLAGEWYLDESRGVPLLASVLVKAPNLRSVRQLLRERILAVDGITEVPTLDLSVDRKTRKMTVSFTARGTVSEFSSSISVG